MRNRDIALLNFNSVSDETDGVIFKAGMQSVTADADGIGVNGAATGSGGTANLDFTSGGISTTGTNNGSVDKVEISIPAAYQSALRGQGRLQFDIRRSDAIGMVSQNVGKISVRDAADSDAHGPRVLFNGGTGRGGSDLISGYIKTYDYACFALDPTWSPTIVSADSQLGISICKKGAFDHATNDWVSLTISWTNDLMTWLINGHTVSISRHLQPTADLTKVVLELVATTLADRLPIRNVILCNHPAPDTRNPKGVDVPRVVTMGHSFWLTGGGAPGWDYDSIERVGSLEHIASQVHYQYTKSGNRMWFKNIAHDGNVRASAATVITGHAESMTGTNLTLGTTGTNTIGNRILRFRPHIALLMVHGSDTSVSTVNTQLTIILDALKAGGVIPIVVREQNRDAGGQDRTSVDQQVQDTVATWRAANGGNNSCGLVDMWTPTGGSTVNTDYVEAGGALLHPSLDVGPLYGASIVAEIRRLLADPPTGSRWATR